MVRVVTESQAASKETTDKRKAGPQPAPASPEQTLTLLAWVQARHPKAVKKLLKQHGVSVPTKISARKLNGLFHAALMSKGKPFHMEVERLVASKLPGNAQHDSFMPMDDEPEDVLGAAMKIGGETGKGAAGGGWVGAALGLGSGITQVVANGQQKKMQAEQQRNTVFQSLMSMRANKGGAGGSKPDSTKTVLLIGGVILVLGGLAFAFWKATRPPAATA